MVSMETISSQHGKKGIFTNLVALSRVRHNPLWLGWDERQIEKAQIEMDWREHHLGPTLAAVACSLVAEHLVTGNPIRYSRRKTCYAYFAKHVDEPLMSYRKIVPVMDLLIEQGWAEGVTGVHLTQGRGKQSIARATQTLVERLAPLLVLEHRRAPKPGDAIVLRDKDGREMPVPDTAETRRMRDDLDVLNDAYSVNEWALRGRRIDIQPLRRIFNENMKRGGRGYHHGSSYQQLSKEEREHLTVDVNGVHWRTVELDYPTLHIQFAYADAGVPTPDGDAYEIEGFERPVVKAALNTMLNAASEKDALGVIGGQLLGDKWNRGRELIAALKEKHPALVPYFGTDAGARFQRMDSDMAIQVAIGVLRRTGRPPLLVHDSFIVAECDENVLAAEMELALAPSQLLSEPPSPKAPTRPYQTPQSALPPTPSSIWGTTPSEQGMERKQVALIRRRDGPLDAAESTDIRTRLEALYT